MIVVLCDSFQDAISSFYTFLHFLEYHEPWHIAREDHYGYFIETDDDIRYVFTDYRFFDVFKKTMGVEFVEQDEFFYGIYDFYFSKYDYDEDEIILDSFI